MCRCIIFCTRPGPGVSKTRRLAPSTCRLEVVMRIPGSSRWLRPRVVWVSSSMSSRRLRASRPAWWALVDWSVRTPVGRDPTVQQPSARTRSGSPAQEYSGHRPWRRFWVGSIGGGTPYPSASRTGARPDIVATLGDPQPSVCLTQHQLSTPRPARTTHSPAPATRVRVVLLPHTRTEPTDTRTNNRHTGKATSMNQSDSSRHHPTQSDGTTVA